MVGSFLEFAGVDFDIELGALDVVVAVEERASNC